MIVAPEPGVDADQEDDAGAVGDGLLGLGLLLSGVVLGVHDVVLHAGLVERLLEEAAVVGLPARRGGAIGEEHPDASFASSVVRSGGARVAVPALFVIAAACGRDRREREHECEQHHDELPTPLA